MKLDVTTNGTAANIVISGKLSVATSPDLEEAVQGLPAQTKDITMDLTDLEYISSAGLRVLVSTQKLVTSRGGNLVLQHPCDEVSEVFEMTGLSDVFTLEA